MHNSGAIAAMLQPGLKNQVHDAVAGLVPGPELCLVIPTFNERDNIVPLVERLREVLAGIAWEVIFVDDDSRDRTLEMVRALSLDDGRIRGMRRINRRGLAGACMEGMLATSAPIVAVMDADLQHDEQCLPEMLAVIRAQTADLVVASRYENADLAVHGLTRIRHAGSRLAIRIAQRILNVAITDPMSGFFMVRREIVETVAPKLSQQGFKILLDIIASSADTMSIREVPYLFKPRQHGESKLDSSVVIEYLGLIVAKASGDLVSSRMLSFGLVGTLGVAVHLAFLRLMLVNGTGLTASQIVAMLAAIVSNYTLNNALTYKDRRRRGWRFVTGLILFAALSSLGVLAGVGVSSFVYSQQSRWWVDGLAAAAIGVAWNYVTSTAVTWRAR